MNQPPATIETQVAIGDINEGCKSLLSQTIDHAQAGVKAKIAESGVDPNDVLGLDTALEDVLNPFQGLETCHLQEKYFQEELGLIVSCGLFVLVLITQNLFLQKRNQKTFVLEDQNTGHSFPEQNITS